MADMEITYHIPSQTQLVFMHAVSATLKVHRAILHCKTLSPWVNRSTQKEEIFHKNLTIYSREKHTFPLIFCRI